VESAAIGLVAGRFAAAERLGAGLDAPPPTPALGALVNHLTGGASSQTFQPMNVNFGLFPALPDEERYKRSHLSRKPALSARALNDLDGWLQAAKAAAA
jgi:methylenetetrahydrofolate--tRNA-(uracil-5-)-methyltransferase